VSDLYSFHKLHIQTFSKRLRHTETYLYSFDCNEGFIIEETDYLVQ